jgi:hypothetical protein
MDLAFSGDGPPKRPAVFIRSASAGTSVPPEALAAMQKADTEKWWPIMRAAGIRAE